MARVNMFLKMASGGKVKQSYRDADSDLMKNSLAKTKFDGKGKEMLISDKVSAAFQSEVISPVRCIVYLPEGKHRINATVGGKPRTIDVEIDSRIGASFAEDLNNRLEKNIRPFAGFDHENGPASFIPQEFHYEEGVGLMLDVEWTEAGRKAIEGKDYSYFSPTFLISPNGIPTGLAPRGEIGSLVNDPAFEEIPRIAAAAAEYNPTNTMIEHLIELGLIEESQDPESAMEVAKKNLADLRESASVAEDDDNNEEMKSAYTNFKKIESELASALEENKSLKDSMTQKAAAAAELAIEDAVKAGRIAPQDDATKSFWLSSIIDNPEAINALHAIPVNPVLSGATVLAGRSESAPQEIPLTGLDRVMAAFKLQSQSL